MEIEYNVDTKNTGRGGWRNGGRPMSAEMKAICDFLDSDNTNIAFIFETDEQARIKAGNLRRSVKEKNIPVTIKKSQNKVIVERNM